MDTPARRRVFQGVACALSAAGSLSAAAYPAAAPAATPTVLHLTQSAERQLPRDRLHVELRAETTADTPQAVEAAINALMAKALAEARRTAGVEVATGSYTVYRTGPANEPPHWTGRQSLTLTGADFGPLLKLAGRLQAAGLVMSNLTYDVAPKTVRGAEDALTVEALAALRQRAAAIAQQLHLAVVGYRDLTIGNAGTDGGPRPLFAMQAKAAAMPAPVAAAGEATVSVTVSADVLLAPDGR
jgi:predicted secreted protein